MIDQLEQITREVIRRPVPESETADTAGRLRHVEKQLADHRRAITDEVGACDGTMYRLAESRYAERSFNMSAILLALVDHYGDLASALRALIDSGAADLRFRYTTLAKLFAQNGIELRRAPHEVGDGDEQHVGEVWKSRINIEAV